MQYFDVCEGPLYAHHVPPIMRGDTPYVSQYRRLIGTAGRRGWYAKFGNITARTSSTVLSTMQ